jgi:hypothetical protein
VKKKILNWALETGKKHRGGDAWRGRSPVVAELEAGEKLVFSKIREAFGGASEDRSSRVVLRWGWIRRGGLRMWGFGSLRGMG